MRWRSFENAGHPFFSWHFGIRIIWKIVRLWKTLYFPYLFVHIKWSLLFTHILAIGFISEFICIIVFDNIFWSYVEIHACIFLPVWLQVSAYLAGLFHSELINRALIVAPKTLTAHWMKELTVVGLAEKIREWVLCCLFLSYKITELTSPCFLIIFFSLFFPT